MIVLLTTVFFHGCSGKGDEIVGDLTSESAEESEIVKESDTTVNWETDPAPKYETITVDGVTYNVYDDHAEIISASSHLIAEREICGVPVTAIADDALEEDTESVRKTYIFADADSFLYDYAVQKGYRFFGFYTGGEPVCYVPPTDDIIVERDSSNEIKYTAPDDSEKITGLVKQYS